MNQLNAAQTFALFGAAVITAAVATGFSLKALDRRFNNR